MKVEKNGLFVRVLKMKKLFWWLTFAKSVKKEVKYEKQNTKKREKFKN